jgi:hypothetical protein
MVMARARRDDVASSGSGLQTAGPIGPDGAQGDVQDVPTTGRRSIGMAVGIASFAVAAWPHGRLGIAATAVLLVLVAADLHVRVYHAARADESNTAYAALRDAPPGRLLELPGFLPDDQRGSAYLYYDMAARRQRPGGYSTTVPRIADTTARRLRKLNCGGWSPDVERLRIRVIAQHGAYYASGACLLRAAQTLRRHGFRLVAADRKIIAWAQSG